ncbi:LCP family protein [Paenibacillus sp. MBLB4367]|uniref:LCP family glycopolymer transferase n=1 Tax=Paenibacillus sp. MBLB4367 TaxID=3384767 RepID=UPI003907F2BC
MSQATLPISPLPPRDKSKRRKWWLIAAAVLFVILAAAGGYTYYLYDKANDVIKQIGTPESVPDDALAHTKPLSFLLLGVDYRKETASMNSDVIMAVTVNPDRKSATVVSLPRDLHMNPKGLPERKANYYFPYFYNQDKKTAFSETKKTFSTFFGFSFDYMATIDFHAFEQTVDALGGLTLDVDMDMRYVDTEDGTDINLKKGTQLLNGKQALDFVRYRKSNRNTEESSDMERNMRQQQVIDKTMEKLKSFGGVLKIGEIMQKVGDGIQTDIPSAQIRSLLQTYFNINRENIQFIHLEGDWISPYIEVTDEDLDNARDALKQQLDLPTATPTPSGSAGTGSNGTGGTGGGTATPKPTPTPTKKPSVGGSVYGR